MPEGLDKKRRLAQRILEALTITMLILVSLGLAFQIYAFNEYRSDVQHNRVIFCQADDLKDTSYCEGVFANANETREGGRARDRLPVEPEQE